MQSSEFTEDGNSFKFVPEEEEEDGVPEGFNYMDTGDKKKIFIEKNKGMGDNIIKIESTKIACSSAETIEASKNYLGLIVYSIGTYNAKKETYGNIYPGWILIREE